MPPREHTSSQGVPDNPLVPSAGGGYSCGIRLEPLDVTELLECLDNRSALQPTSRILISRAVSMIRRRMSPRISSSRAGHYPKHPKAGEQRHREGDPESVGPDAV